MSKTGLYRLVGTLYITQYLGIGFTMIGMSGILRSQGIGLDKLATFQALGLVWAVKFLWAPLVDRFGSRRHGHYRSWLLVLQPLMVVSLLLLGLIRPSQGELGPLLALTGLFVLFSATQDIAADAIAVRLIAPQDRGLVNGLQIAGGYLGHLIGGGLTVVVYDHHGWLPAIIMLAALTATGLIVISLFDEPAGDRRQQPPARLLTAYASLWTVFSQKGATRWAFAVVPLFYVGVSVGYSLMTPALVDIGWSLSQIGVVVSVISSVPALAGAILGGWAINRWGSIKTIITGGALSLLATFALLPLFAGHRIDPLITLAICLYMGSYSVVSTVLYTVNMDYSRAKSAGSDYTVLSSIAMVFSFVAGAVALGVAKQIGYLPVALGSMVLLIIGIPLAASHLRRHATPRAHEEDVLPTAEPVELIS